MDNLPEYKGGYTFLKYIDIDQILFKVYIRDNKICPYDVGKQIPLLTKCLTFPSDLSTLGDLFQDCIANSDYQVVSGTKKGLIYNPKSQLYLVMNETGNFSFSYTQPKPLLYYKGAWNDAIAKATAFYNTYVDIGKFTPVSIGSCDDASWSSFNLEKCINMDSSVMVGDKLDTSKCMISYDGIKVNGVPYNKDARTCVIKDGSQNTHYLGENRAWYPFVSGSSTSKTILEYCSSPNENRIIRRQDHNNFECAYVFESDKDVSASLKKQYQEFSCNNFLGDVAPGQLDYCSQLCSDTNSPCHKTFVDFCNGQGKDMKICGGSEPGPIPGPSPNPRPIPSSSTSSSKLILYVSVGIGIPVLISIILYLLKRRKN